MGRQSLVLDDGTRDRSADSQALLSIRDLKTYFFTDEGTVKAVDGVSLNVYPSHSLGIVGESGCGKSITAKSILQIVERPGRIVDGEIVYSPDASSRVDLFGLVSNGEEMRSIRGGAISMIFQEPMASFSPVHTLGNQIVEAIKLHTSLNGEEARELAVDWLNRVGIPNPRQRMREYAHQLSGGQLQRAMIAMALCTNPNILIADEPTTALDVTTQAQILNLLQSLQEENDMAVIFITHDLGVIAEVADDVTVMYLGRIVESGPVTTIFGAPKHPYTRSLLTSIPNIYTRPRERLPAIRGSIPHPQNRPTGCPFHPRCPSFMPGVCDERDPALVFVEKDVQASCFLYEGA